MPEEVLLNVEDRIATLAFNRPDKRNAFTEAMVETLVEHLERCSRDDDVHVVVLTGAGDAFCSGGDIGDFGNRAARTPHAIKQRLAETTQRLPRTLMRMSKPTIAAINGLAYGAGLDIAMACDLRYAAEDAKLSEVYARMALIPGAGATWLMPRLVGTARALELMWTTDAITGTQAEAMGLVNRAFPRDRLMPETLSIARRIADGPTLAIRSIKRLVYNGLQTSFEAALDQASSEMPLVRTSLDHQEALAAYKEKRPPRYTGR